VEAELPESCRYGLKFGKRLWAIDLVEYKEGRVRQQRRVMRATFVANER
jgi:hypothetical protein